MKLILLKDVPNLGKTGDVIEAKNGYARNYLLPGKYALEVSEFNIKAVEKSKRNEEIKIKKQKEQAAELAKKLANTSCTISMPAGEDDKLFGAVTAQDIADVLKQEGISIDKRDITIKDPIHKLGIYNVDVKLHPEIVQEVKVWVIKK